MWMPKSPLLDWFSNEIVTQSPSLARIASGWMASLPCSPIETCFDFSCARTADHVLLSAYICPSGSWSRKRFRVMSTSIETTSKCRTGAPDRADPASSPTPRRGTRGSSDARRGPELPLPRAPGRPPRKRRLRPASSAMGNATASARAASRASCERASGGKPTRRARGSEGEPVPRAQHRRPHRPRWRVARTGVAAAVARRPARYARPNASGKPIRTSRRAVNAGDGPTSARPAARCTRASQMPAPSAAAPAGTLGGIRVRTVVPLLVALVAVLRVVDGRAVGAVGAANRNLGGLAVLAGRGR